MNTAALFRYNSYKYRLGYPNLFTPFELAEVAKADAEMKTWRRKEDTPERVAKRAREREWYRERKKRLAGAGTPNEAGENLQGNHNTFAPRAQGGTV